MNTIDFYYFSGTGNTLLVVRRMADVFNKNNIQAKLLRIESSNPRAINKDNVIGLAFPVAGQSTYPFIWDFIYALPPAAGTKIFMVDTLAGFSGGIVGPLKKILNSKGYETLGAEEIIMPANLFYIYSDKTSARLVAKGLKTAEKYANQIMSGTSRWGRIPFFSDLVFFLYWHVVRRLWLSRWNQNKFRLKADEGKCTKCGICARLCPVKNITMRDFPAFGTKCNYCIRCMSWCPARAIPCGFNFKGKTYTAPELKPSDLLSEQNITGC